MPENNSRLLISNATEYTSLKLTEYILGEKLSLGQNFYLGQVIDSSDTEKTNRLRVRIPIIDDIFYRDDKGNLNDTLGHDKLPWCIPSNNRFIDTPENGSLVLVGLFDPENPYLGRVWFSEVGFPTKNKIFDANELKQTETDLKAWENSEKLTGVKYNFSPTNKNRTRIKSKTNSTNYEVGVKGKDKNLLLFEKSKTTLVQNLGDKKETKIELTDKASITSKNIEILSTNTLFRKENPVFAKPLFLYETKLLVILQAMATLLSTVPALTTGIPLVFIPGTPLLPNPAFAGIVSQLASLQADLERLKVPGQGFSKYIDIN